MSGGVSHDSPEGCADGAQSKGKRVRHVRVCLGHFVTLAFLQNAAESKLRVLPDP